jgi:soluble lytic murein transglycosylase-like protein
VKKILAIALWCAGAACAAVPTGALQYRATLVREAQFVYGPGAPIPMFAGQIHQESRWRADVTAWDNGRGLAQFMDGTAAQVAKSFPELGAPNPYDPRWAIRAMVRFDGWIYQRVQGASACDRWAASLKGYNAGAGYVQRAQRRSPTPGRWFGATEMINAGQSAKNFEYSRMYPRWILLKHQPLYAAWGPLTCRGVQ